MTKKFHILSFKYAISGIIAALKEEPNMGFHFLAALIVVALGFFFGISKIEWLIIIMLFGLVFSVELTNTAIEAVVDHFTSSEHQGAKLAKDISAGAVLVSALTAAVIGAIIFIPYIFHG